MLYFKNWSASSLLLKVMWSKDIFTLRSYVIGNWDWLVEMR